MNKVVRKMYSHPDLSLKLRQDVKPVNAEFTGFCFEYTSFCCKVFQLEGDHGSELKKTFGVKKSKFEYRQHTFAGSVK
jgi:hypothetical protein